MLCIIFQSITILFEYVVKGLEGLHVMHFICVRNEKKKKSVEESCLKFSIKHVVLLLMGLDLPFLFPPLTMSLSIYPYFCLFIRKINEIRSLIFFLPNLTS